MTEIYGTVSVKSIEEKVYAFFTKRKLEVSQRGVNSEYHTLIYNRIRFIFDNDF